MLNKKSIKKIKIGIVGCGVIGREVSLFIDKELQNAVCLCALAEKDIKRAEKLQKRLKSPAKIYDIEALIKKVDLVIETASVEAARFVLKKALTYRKDVIVLSVGALIDNAFILKEAGKRKINIYAPSGAICGVDGLGALSMGNIKKVSLVTSKPPHGLIGADYIKRKGIDLTNLKEKKIIFKGKTEEAIRYFPRNINVAVALSLASSFKNVEVCIQADPRLKRNVHHIRVDAKEARLNINIENIPSESNPKTSALAILSTQYLLKKIFSPFKIGS